MQRMHATNRFGATVKCSRMHLRPSVNKHVYCIRGLHSSQRVPKEDPHTNIPDAPSLFGTNNTRRRKKIASSCQLRANDVRDDKLIKSKNILNVNHFSTNNDGVWKLKKKFK